MFQRVMTAVIGIPLLIAVLYKGGLLLFLALLIISTLGLYEYCRAVNLDDNVNINIPMILSLGVLLLLTFKINEQFVMFGLIFSLMSIFARQVIVNTVNVLEGIYAFFGLFYVTFLLGHILLFDNLENGNLILPLVFIVSFSTDTFAYIIGVKFGKHKLCPLFSPKKSIEGAIGGIAGSILLTLVYGYIMNYFGLLDFSIAYYILLSLSASVIAQLGDLTASSIKRSFKIKDFGNIFPGHGGVLDRFDSIIYATPIVYYFTLLYLYF